MDLSIAMHRLCAELDARDVNLEQFLKNCARLTADVVGCSRAGIWMFIPGRKERSMHCLAMYDRIRSCMTIVDDERGEHVDAYFRALDEFGFVVAPDVRSHVSIRGFFDKQDKSCGVTSLLASGFSANGKLYGAFTCTQLGQRREWGGKDLHTMRFIGTRASLALTRDAERNLLETCPVPLDSLRVLDR